MSPWAWRRILYLALTVVTLATGAASFWALAQNPFAGAIVERSLGDARAVLERHAGRVATPAYVIDAVSGALESGDAEQLQFGLDLAAAREIVLPPALQDRAEAELAADSAPGRRITGCAACAWDVADCTSVAQLASCALPVEITPLGDVNALRRAAVAYGSGAPVDRLDLGLAVVGLTATGAVVVTAGGSAAIKAGATVLRLARRSGRLTPGLTRVLMRDGDILREGARLPAYLAGRVPLSAVADTARLGRLSRLAGDLGTVARNTSPADTVALLRHVDSAGDAASLARVSRIQGTQSRATLRLLGKARTFRALVRLSDMALLTLGLLAALAAQLLTLGLAGLRQVLRP